MPIWFEIVLLAITLIGVGVVTVFFIAAVFYVRSLKYLGVDLPEFLKNVDNRQRRNELILERLGQRVGLALWRIQHNLEAFPAYDQETKDYLKALKEMSGATLAIDWKKVTPENPLKLSGELVVERPSPKNEREKNAHTIIKEALDELEQLQKVSLLVGHLFEMSLKIEFIEK